MARRDERGSTLVIALFFIMLFSILVPVLLGLASTGARITSKVVDDRHQAYVASSALDAAIQHGRTARWVGRVGLVCPTMSLNIDGDIAVVRCTSNTGLLDLDRRLTYEVRMGGVTVARAHVIFRDGTAGTGEPRAEVLDWAPA